MYVAVNKKTGKSTTHWTNELDVNEMHIAVPMNIDYLQSTNKFICRPKGALGNCGFHPFPWIIASGNSPSEAGYNFVKNNRKALAQHGVNSE